MSSVRFSDSNDSRNSLRGLPWIFIPSIDNSNLQWTVQEDCRWTGPSWLSCRHVLSSIKEYRNLQTLLCAHMEVKNATWEDSIEELNQMKTNSKSDQPKVRTIYESLWSEFSKDKIGTLLRYVFHLVGARV